MDSQSKITWDPYVSGYFDNPYHHLKECRQHNPVHKILGEAWMFLGYREVSEVLASKDFKVFAFSQFLKEKEPYIFKNTNTCPYLSEGTKMWTMYLNGKRHKQARAAIGKSMIIHDLPDVMDQSVTYLNHQYQSRDNFDLVTYCGEFIFLVIRKILGINTTEAFEKIRTYSNMLARSQDLFIPRQVYQQINDWLLWGKDIFSDSKFHMNLTEQSQKNGLNYSEDEMYSLTCLALMAAFETSKDNLSVALYEIIQRPELQDYVLDADDQGINILIEELFRFSTPLQYTIRINQAPLPVGNIVVPSGSKLYLSLASANRDEKVFSNPDEIIADRTPNEHIAFGKGQHLCLGASIARTELRHCLKPMIKLMREYQPIQSPKWSRQIFMRTLESVEIRRKRK